MSENKSNEVENILQAIRLADLDKVKEVIITVKDLVEMANLISNLRSILKSDEIRMLSQVERINTLVADGMQILEKQSQHLDTYM